MIEVRLFATLRNNREKILSLDATACPDGMAILDQLAIPKEDVAIFLINGIHSKLDDPINEGDIIAIFPPVGGG